MTRKQLEDLGLTKEQADAVIKINGDDIENAKTVLSAELKNMQTEVDGLKGQVKDRDKQLEALKTAAGDNEALTQQIADLQKTNKDTVAAHESEMNRLKVDFAVEKALTNAKAKNVKAVKALLDLEEVKFDKEGNIAGLAEQIEKLTIGEDTKFLFNEAQQNQQTFKGYQPGTAMQQKPGGEANPAKMNYDELCAYFAQNSEANLGE